ncbi:helix-turn-helix transcriptional regulator [Raoultibacter phocaeensis]|uniref:helix-turn-helix transcriptional regulator n=1 Tax=Raoultibacter phocaeensis TaxID=2479841 RepID=UPI0015D5ED4B|nr:helix-turn-helix transcriptional regulator [Raoultibacter phocaeensis]
MQKKTTESHDGLLAQLVHLPNEKGAARILASINWPFAVGFALCQTWNVLCVSLPDPITYTSPFLDLRWVSLSTALALSVAAAVCPKRARKALRNRRFNLGIGIVAALGSMLGPLSALVPELSVQLIYLAAIAVGVGFAGLFLAWFDAFVGTRDMMGLAISVVVATTLTYPLANMLASDQMSPWVSAAIASILPLASIALLWRNPKSATLIFERDPAKPDARRKRLLLRFCLCLFLVIAIIEAVRNLLLNGTAITFYAGVINLGALALKLACSVWLLAIFDARSADGVSALYRTAFVLLLGVVLCIPYLLEGNWIAHTLLDLSSFFFQLTMIMVAFEISIGFSLCPVLVFGYARTAWAAGALAGIGLEQLCRTVGVEAVQALAVVLGLAAAVAFVFVFTERDCVEILSSLPLPVHTPRFKRQCDHLAKRSGISDRESEVLTLVAKGRSASRIAEDLSVSLATVNSHVHHIYQKLGIHSRQELIDLIENERVLDE